jgi:ABC-type Fe3+/spermidine/putrescine transport system ATPase subunit
VRGELGRSTTGLACRDLVVAPGGSVVLRRLSLQIPGGTRTVVVGPSGAGKTTLLRAIAGLERLLEGEIWLGSRRLDTLPAHRRRIAVVFQEPRLLPHLDVADNVAFGLRAAGVARAARRARALALLDEVGLAGFDGRGIDGLSGGEQQRVALARALCVEPDLLLLDEPLAGVDPNRRDGLRRLLVELQQARALTTLLITHDRAEAAQLGERVALLLDGTIVQHGTPQALFERGGGELLRHPEPPGWPGHRRPARPGCRQHPGARPRRRGHCGNPAGAGPPGRERPAAAGGDGGQLYRHPRAAGAARPGADAAGGSAAGPRAPGR